MINFNTLTILNFRNFLYKNSRVKIKYQGKHFVLMLDNKIFEIGKTLKELFENIIFNNKKVKTIKTHNKITTILIK